MTTAEVEYAVAQHIDIRRNLIVPNVWWGMGLPFECDLLYVTGSNYAHEVEIKVSRSDLVRDKKKRRHIKPKWGYTPSTIRSRTFAIPADMEECINEIPESCGIILVSKNRKCRVLRKATINTRARKLTEAELLQMYRLMAMRVWSMKKKMLGVK